jgi:hypothetical protein
LGQVYLIDLFQFLQAVPQAKTVSVLDETGPPVGFVKGGLQEAIV